MAGKIESIIESDGEEFDSRRFISNVFFLLNLQKRPCIYHSVQLLVVSS